MSDKLKRILLPIGLPSPSDGGRAGETSLEVFAITAPLPNEKLSDLARETTDGKYAVKPIMARLLPTKFSNYIPLW